MAPRFSVRRRLSRGWRRAIVFGVPLVVGVYAAGRARWHENMLRVPPSPPPPVRRTPLYVAGRSADIGMHPRPTSMPLPLFCAFVVYRIVLLFVRSVPLVWFACLTFLLHSCSHELFFFKLRDFLTLMGPTYVKLGQWMASRPDFFPPAMCSVLETLYDHTSEHSWRHTERLLRKPFKDGAAQGSNALFYFSEIERKPINSGSIAQIHRAKLRVDVDAMPAGTELAIKVTHPHIREQVAADVAAMKLFVKLANLAIPGLRLISLENSVHEFSRLIYSQLNLLIEADNLRQFTYNFRDVPGILFPQPLPSLCTEDVLIETFEEGEGLQNVVCTAEHLDVADLGCHMFLKMLFEDNFVHSDLHPGNILLRTNKLPSAQPVYYRDGKRKLAHEIVVLDAGLVTTLSQRERNNFISLFAAVACGDGELGANLMLDRLPEGSSTVSKVNRAKFQREMKDIFDLVSPTTQGFRLSTIDIGDILTRIITTVRENNAPLDGNFASLVLTVIIGEGLGRKLSSDFNFFAESAPYLVAFLENEELYFLANKLKTTYGAPALLRESVSFVRPAKTPTYIEITLRKAKNVIRYLFLPTSSAQRGDG